MAVCGKLWYQNARARGLIQGYLYCSQWTLVPHTGLSGPGWTLDSTLVPCQELTGGVDPWTLVFVQSGAVITWRSCTRTFTTWLSHSKKKSLGHEATMGAFFSKVAAFLRRRRHSSLARTPTPKADPLTSPAQNSRTQPRSKPAASDLVFENLTAQTACKRPGSLGSCYGPGVPFEIYNCSDASLFVLDWTAQVTVDKCKNCFIFIGPCAGSLFLRDCTGCTVVVAAQQLRTRDCVDLRLHAFVLTQPIIESSTAVSVGCFAGHYAALDEQFAAAGLSVWNSVWWDLYDFNDKTGRNYTLMSKVLLPSKLYSDVWFI